MESNGFLLANGRTPSDSPADYTYVSKTGSSVIDGFLLANGRTPSDSPADYTYVSKTGSSVIELVFLNDPSGLRDLSVVDFLHSSPHLPVIIEMATDVVYANQKDEKEMATQYIFRWDEGKMQIRKMKKRWLLSIDFDGTKEREKTTRVC
ncbi:hypothetical protein QE152_g23115 [Popillia japonica]|uniref:Uncharacterized protein n=1 Tax=Popillia japonica TaxID=7064 RepID=A0AAW1KIG8_POPJA